MTNKELVQALVEKGFTYQAVGDLLGVSRQRVHQILTKSVTNRVSLGKKIIYPNLLEWSLEQKCNREDFLSRMGFSCDAASKNKLSRILTGKQMPTKDYIDKMIQATGLSYETLFEVFPDGD